VLINRSYDDTLAGFEADSTGSKLYVCTSGGRFSTIDVDKNIESGRVKLGKVLSMSLDEITGKLAVTHSQSVDIIPAK
jgi:hypothetical protein